MEGLGAIRRCRPSLRSRAKRDVQDAARCADFGGVPDAPRNHDCTRADQR